MSRPIPESALMHDRTLERLRRLEMQVPLMSPEELRNHEATHDRQFYTRVHYETDMQFIRDALRKAEYHDHRGEPEKAQFCRDLAIKRRGMMYRSGDERHPEGQ